MTTVVSHQNSAACYQLAQSVLKIGSAVAERVGRGEMSGCHPEGDSSWQLLQLDVEKPWSMPGGPLFCFLAQMGLEALLLLCRGSISEIFGSFQSGGALSGRRALTIERSLMSGCGQGHELIKDMWKKLWLKFPGLTRSRSGNAGEKRCD